MGVFQKIKDALNEAALIEYEEYLLEIIPPNGSTNMEGLSTTLKEHTTDGELIYVVDTGEGLKEGYYTVIYIFGTGEKCSRVYHEVKYNFKKQRWTDEPFYNEAYWKKLHKNDRLYITSDKQEASMMVKAHCFEAWKNKRRK